MSDQHPDLLLDTFNHVVESALPGSCLPDHLSQLSGQRVLVLAAGKAAASMSAAAAESLGEHVRGLAVTRYGHGLKPGESCGSIEVIEAGHPVPDASAAEAADRMMQLAATIEPDEVLLFLVSGGGSSLLAAPSGGLPLEAKKQAITHLMTSGADIHEINTVRRHLSRLKGGRLAEVAHPNRVVTLAISDVPGDQIWDIASGPTVPDPTTIQAAEEVLQRYGCPDAAHLIPHLTETPKPGHPGFTSDLAEIVASSTTGLAAAQDHLERGGWDVINLGEACGDARALGAHHAQLALNLKEEMRRAAVISGGETTTILHKAEARGGRNLEYLASVAARLDGAKGIWAMAADTDGIDGSSDAAGAWFGPGKPVQQEAQHALGTSETHLFFGDLQLLIRTGPTRTNIIDFRLLLVDP